MPNESRQSGKKRGRGRPKGSKNKARSSSGKSASSSKTTARGQSSSMGQGAEKPGQAPAQGSADAANLPPYGSPPISISGSSEEDDPGSVEDFSESGDGWTECESWDLSDWRDMRYVANTLVARTHIYIAYWTQSQRDRLALAFLACSMAMKPST
ncbi:hypothetical protein CF327_g3512 [Tilletia walkeri]|uniref:Uncharacterized protein n=1 Tax=Tilletia walkeri TaxID=117179 RepID=A0A8X7N391_9BASI|nr:hypothetical protein CF327_g3512 [Tilletia walkeri]KAE8262571.1 hypothetical protein A4X09_0g7429 [Tilletia walkeri]